MKLVFLCDAWQPIVGGGQKLFQEITNRLVKDHHCEITIITRALRYEGKTFSKPETYFNQRLQIIRLGPALAFFNPLGRIWFTLQSVFYALKFKPNIYLASTWLPALSLQLIKLFKKTPIVLVAIGFGSRLPWLEKLITQKLKYNLIITDDYRFYKTNPDIEFIPNGVTLPKKLNLTKHSNFTFLTIARNEPRKGIPILQQAFVEVKKQFPQTKLRLFGPGFTTLSQQELDQELFQANCLVLPSLAEGHPLILFEAWAHQLAVIATDVGSISQFVNGDNGYLVPANDVQALARTMKLAIQNPSLAVMGANGYQLVSQHYSWSKTISQYSQALSKLSNIQ
ncbi:MAG: glycosyltransferase family 4 protein [Patescibacteria group bacterium]|nr:glycosyltransferase family 4 protein [Patescibacteria group bacterium]